MYILIYFQSYNLFPALLYIFQVTF